MVLLFSPICILSHILHFSGTFKHFPEYTVPESHQRVGKAPAFEHFPNTTRLHKMPRPVAHPLTSNTFCSVSPLPVAACLTFCTFRVLLNTSSRKFFRVPQDTSRELKKVPIFEHFPTLHLSTFRCTSRNLEHFLGYRTVFYLQSRLTSCTFWVFLNTFGRRLIQSTPGYIRRAEESTHL